MSTFKFALALAGALFVTAPVAAQRNEPPKTIDEAVKKCVDVVHATKAEEMDREFFKHFDAYYNPASQLVENNAYRNGDRLPLYTFNKCMVQVGFPLGSPKSSNQ